MLNQETVVSTLINAVVPPAIVWFLKVPPPQALLGPHSILGAIVPASGLATLVMTLIITLIVRRRVASGQVQAFVWPQAERGAWRFIPEGLVLRALVLAITAIVLLVPVTFVIFAVAHILPLSRIGALISNIVFGAAVGLTMTRFIVLPALADKKAL